MTLASRLLNGLVTVALAGFGSIVCEPTSAGQGPGATQERQAEQILPPDIFEELFRDFGSELGPALSEIGPPVRSVDRNRQASRFEKMHRSELRKYTELVVQAKAGIVRIESDGETICFGTIVQSDGYLVTKASELANHDEIICYLANGENHEPEVIGVRADHDLALLKLPAENLKPIIWAAESPSIGSFVVTGDETGRPLASGVASVERRVFIDTNQAVLGVVPQPVGSEVIVESVAEGSAADMANLQAGDTILAIEGVAIGSVNELTNQIRLHQPGDDIEIQIERDGKRQVARATLGGRTLASPFQQSVSEKNRFGAEPSRRATNFPQVIQHDSPLWPEQCGTPLINLDGEAVGINIARGGRIESYAIPADVVQQVVTEMLAEDAK